ncbi:ribonuclease H-like domain-containing protein [Tanacetum coccineum]
MWPVVESRTVIIPPLYKPPIGRPPKKRKKSNDEIASQSASSGKLSRKGNQAGARKVSGQAAGTTNVSGEAVGARKVSSQVVGATNVSGQAAGARKVSGQAVDARMASNQHSAAQSTTKQGPRQGNNLLSWSSKRQHTLSRSSAEAEYRGVANDVAETAWLRNLLRELHTPLVTATLLYCDNVSVVYLSANPIQHQRTKHIEIDIHFVRDIATAGLVRVLHIPSRYQYADIFTKGLPSTLFEKFRTSLSVRSPPPQTAGRDDNTPTPSSNEKLIPFGVTSISNSVPIKLSLEKLNYNSWSSFFTIHLGSLGLKKHIEAASTSTETVDPEWSRLDDLVKIWILGTCTESLQDQVVSTPVNAKALWDHIKDLFHDNEDARAITLDNQLRSIKIAAQPSILGPVLTFIPTKETLLPNAFSTMTLQDPSWNMDTGFLDSPYPLQM